MSPDLLPLVIIDFFSCPIAMLPNACQIISHATF